MQEKNSVILISMKKEFLIRLFGGIVYILLMIIFSIAAIGYASGYRYNTHNKHLYKSSVLRITSDPVANIYLNGRLEKSVSKKKINIFDPLKSLSNTETLNLEPGRYTVSLYREGYSPYKSTFSLGQGELRDIKDVILFRSLIEPKFEELAYNPLSYVDSSLIGDSSNPYILHDHEVWFQNQLVSRFGDRVLSVKLYNDNYIAYQTTTYFGIIQTDGFNNTKFFEYQSEIPFEISFSDHQKNLEANANQVRISARIR